MIMTYVTSATNGHQVNWGTSFIHCCLVPLSHPDLDTLAAVTLNEII